MVDLQGKCAVSVAPLAVLRSLPKGEYIQRTHAPGKTYRKGDYDRATKSFECIDTDDINRSIFIKADKLVVAGFTF